MSAARLEPSLLVHMASSGQGLCDNRERTLVEARGVATAKRRSHVISITCDVLSDVALEKARMVYGASG
eukprot:689201-Hanusia_phi.AAC.1